MPVPKQSRNVRGFEQKEKNINKLSRKTTTTTSEKTSKMLGLKRIYTYFIRVYPNKCIWAPSVGWLAVKKADHNIYLCAISYKIKETLAVRTMDSKWSKWFFFAKNEFLIINAALLSPCSSHCRRAPRKIDDLIIALAHINLHLSIGEHKTALMTK